MNCRHCGATLSHIFLDLGMAPPSNAYLSSNHLNKPEVYYPLRVLLCNACWLVQTEDFAQPDQLFHADYAYFSSISKSFLRHAACYSSKMKAMLNLNSNSFVLEIASNDGYLLKNFVAYGIPCLGIEPTQSTAFVAEKLGIPVIKRFFDSDLALSLANEGKRADLIVANNVLAHVPDINNFVRGLKLILKPFGTITLEFPHLLRLIRHGQFDTVYHEHFSYLSLHAVKHIFEAAGLRILDVEELPVHGGSLRIYCSHEENPSPELPSVSSLLAMEEAEGLLGTLIYGEFQARVDHIKNELLVFLIEQKKKGKKVVGYGAAAKGNTLLNYAGVRQDLLPFVCDAAPSKQYKFLPGSHIPILNPAVLQIELPDYILILPWNIADEIIDKNYWLAEKGTKFVKAVPELVILK
ncbi:class I SAM-dependent methyltransferase [Desulfobotulus sp. H1]|uniref:Class I SAM-dependent methyltransferase n=1 Tax=Desulfobotulus pelophilus TaxID=2823377 RepID=A0ABT3ND44_9BACT|nr:class I SAM-dependent methyltransferase [Desulfobotulus pelophilus]MCW7755340.1 class I SAM-dependent methyltransferase [Desulfobotulus pelophilus]